MKNTLSIKNRGYYNRYDKRVMLLKEGDILEVVKIIDSNADKSIHEFRGGYYCLKDGIPVFVEFQNVDQLNMNWERE